MALNSKQLEAEIAAMEGRLASVKVTVEIEKHAWQRVAQKGKKGTKWRGAASASASVAITTTSRSEMETHNGEIVAEPLQWDSLELAQYLQSKRLAPYAQRVVHEQITGKVLLETPVGKLRSLFGTELKSDPAWNKFVRVCLQLHKLQPERRSLPSGNNNNTSDANTELSSKPQQKQRGPPPSRAPWKGTAFPLISPRLPALTALSLSTKTHKPQPPPAASLQIGDAPPRLTTQASQAMHRKPAAATAASQPMATCWNCSARFPRTTPLAAPSRSGGTVAPSPSAAARAFCSETCQLAIDSSAMSVSASLSIAVTYDAPPPTVGVPKPPPSHAAVALNAAAKSPRRRPFDATAAASTPFDFLQVAARPQPEPIESTRPAAATGTVAKQQSGRKRIAAASVGHSAVRCLPPEDVVPPTFLLHGANSSRLDSCVFQQSRYKLDPQLFHANGVAWTACFDATTVSSSSSNDAVVVEHNVKSLVGYLSPQAVYHLSLTSRKWFELLHLHAATADHVWGLLLRRAWIQTDADVQCLRDLGFLSAKTSRPRRVMMKLMRQTQKIALDGTKVLLCADNWQLAPTCRTDVDYLPLPLRPFGPRQLQNNVAAEPIDRGNDLYEVITLVCTRSCEIVAVQAQDLLRPLAENGSTVEILRGVKSGTLFRVDCRRLRLFSLANRLPLSDWYLLSDVRVVLEFCAHPGPEEAAELTIWQRKLLRRLQKQLEKRLVGRESIQQVTKWMQDRNAPPQAMAALEQFLARLAGNKPTAKPPKSSISSTVAAVVGERRPR